jgi:hypothetical protein
LTPFPRKRSRISGFLGWLLASLYSVSADERFDLNFDDTAYFTMYLQHERMLIAESIAHTTTAVAGHSPMGGDVNGA